MATDDDGANDAEGDPTPNETESTATRYRYTNDLIAGSLVVFAIAATGVYVYRGDGVPLWLASVVALSVLTAVVWAFGSGAFAAARKALGNE